MVNAASLRCVAAIGAPSVRYQCPLDVRVDIQMSAPPKPPARVDAKIKVRASCVSDGWTSLAVLLSGAPTFSGADHGSCTLRRVDRQRSDAPRLPARLE